MLSVPADLRFHHLRRQFLAQQRGAVDPLRTQLGILVEQCDTANRAKTPEELADIEAAMWKQVGVIDGSTRTTPF